MFMMTEKPVFRFVGNIETVVRVQFEMAMIAKKFFDLLVEKHLHDRAKIEETCGDHIAYLKEILRKADVVVYSPRWFADLLE